jgi:hypothetical protein
VDGQENGAGSGDDAGSEQNGESNRRSRSREQSPDGDDHFTGYNDGEGLQDTIRKIIRVANLAFEAYMYVGRFFCE